MAVLAKTGVRLTRTLTRQGRVSVRSLPALGIRAIYREAILSRPGEASASGGGRGDPRMRDLRGTPEMVAAFEVGRSTRGGWIMVRRAVLLSLAATGAGVLVLAGMLLWPVVVENWHLAKLTSGSDPERRSAARKLAELGSPRAIPLLVAILGEGEGEESYTFAIEALVTIGDPAVPALRELLADEEPQQRLRAVAALRAAAPRAPDAVLALVDRLRSEEERQVWIAIEEALEETGSVAFPALVSMLEGEERLAVRSRAARVLRNIDPNPARYPDVVGALERYNEENLEHARRGFREGVQLREREPWHFLHAGAPEERE